jgi:hypothetical protein
LRGGLPAHNNGVEGVNNGDKVAFDNRKPVTVEFIGTLVNEIATKSQIDLLFHEKNLHTDVHSNKFYASVHSFREASQMGIATFLNVNFPFVDRRLGFGKGSLLVVSSSFLEGGISPNDANYKESLPKLMHAANQNGSNKRARFRDRDQYRDPTYVKGFIQDHGIDKEYKAMWRSPDTHCKKRKFDEIIKEANRFHVMVPIVIDSNDREATRNLGFFLLLLKNCGLNPLSVEAVKEKKERGLMRCHCKTYLQLAWCVHACVFAFHHGVQRNTRCALVDSAHLV